MADDWGGRVKAAARDAFQQFGNVPRSGADWRRLAELLILERAGLVEIDSLKSSPALRQYRLARVDYAAHLDSELERASGRGSPIGAQRIHDKLRSTYPEYQSVSQSTLYTDNLKWRKDANDYCDARWSEAIDRGFATADLKYQATIAISDVVTGLSNDNVAVGDWLWAQLPMCPTTQRPRISPELAGKCHILLTGRRWLKFESWTTKRELTDALRWVAVPFARGQLPATEILDNLIAAGYLERISRDQSDADVRALLGQIGFPD